MTSEVEDEILALSEIFQRDFKELPVGAWGSRRFSIIARVNSSTSAYNYGSVTLEFELPKTYPKVSPIVKVLAPSDMISKDKTSLDECVQSYLKKNSGAIMCFDLIQTVQDMLLRIGPLKIPKSMYETMQEREKKESQALLSFINAAKPKNESIPSPALPKKSASQEIEVEWIDNAWLTALLERKEEESSSSKVVSSTESQLKSRYLEEFIELAILGRGASGEVCKCKHRLDDRLYAIKKILVHERDTSLFKEVRYISSLIHKHIVRYFSAWVEYHDLKPTKSGTLSVDSSVMGGESPSYSDDKFALPLNQFTGYDFISGNNHEFSSDISEESSVGLRIETGECETASRGHEGSYAVLYIQMEYCKATLRDMIDSGSLYERPSEIFHFLRQILEALAYIHSEGVIHRDLKPANIFLDSQANIRVGDFGLATFAHLSDSSAVSHSIGRSDVESSLTAGVGTALYRAPEYERLESARRDSGDKADMFSLGIVLFEMASPPFPTGMERIAQITALREEGIISRSISITSSLPF